MLTIAECVAIVAWCLENVPYDELRWRFQRKFRKAGSTNKSIWILLNKFKWTGTVADESRPGRPFICEAVIEVICESNEWSPKSVHSLARQLNISRSKVLKFVLKNHAYHLQVLHQLHEENLVEHMAMCMDLLDSADRWFNETCVVQRWGNIPCKWTCKPP